MRSLIVVSLLVSCIAGRAAAQPRTIPAPKLPISVDSNDAVAVMLHAAQQLRGDPEQALRAYVLAGHLDPGSASARLGERAARLHSDVGLRRSYLDGRRRVHRDLRIIDSLDQEARMRDPFIGPAFEYEILQQWAESEFRELPAAEVRMEIDRQMFAGGPASAGWLGHVKGDLHGALKYYSKALDEKPKLWQTRVHRARLYVAFGMPDSAAADFERVLVDIAAEKDSSRLTIVYAPQTMLRHSLGLVAEQRGDTAKAREEYSKALEEDLAFWPAQLRLATMQFAAGDTANALSTLELIAQANPTVAHLQYAYGIALARAGRIQDALAPLNAAITAEPRFAAPHYVLGVLYDRAEMTTEALAAYRAFLSRASGNAKERPRAEERIAALAAGGAP
jgi:tetratricopeptide (TPR) repeat protein